MRLVVGRAGDDKGEQESFAVWSFFETKGVSKRRSEDEKSWAGNGKCLRVRADVRRCRRGSVRKGRGFLRAKIFEVEVGLVGGDES